METTSNLEKENQCLGVNIGVSVARRVMGCFNGAVALLIGFVLLLLLFSSKALAKMYFKKNNSQRTRVTRRQSGA